MTGTWGKEEECLMEEKRAVNVIAVGRDSVETPNGPHLVNGG